MPLVLVAAIFLFVAGGLADVTTLGHSQIPTHASRRASRALLVTLDLGLGAGLAARRRVPPAPAACGAPPRPATDADGSGAVPVTS